MVMKPINRRSVSSGSVMVEYMIVVVFLMIMIWYAVVGGSFNWMDPTTHTGTGNQVDRVNSNATPYAGVANTLHDKQESFRSRIYQP